MRGKNPAVLAVELLNPYNGIDATQNERHLIRDVQGQPLRRGIFVDAIYDIGRIENVHFNPWWSMKPKLFEWQQEHGEAFIFGTSDWQYVFNTFCFGYNVGYKFIKTKAGDCNGNFLGIGADDCFTALVVEQSAPIGLLISNGEFVSFHGPGSDDGARGHEQHRQRAFRELAPSGGRAIRSRRSPAKARWVSAIAPSCNGIGNKEGRHAIQVEGGSVIVRGCEFRADRPQIELGTSVRRAVITDNLLNRTSRISNESAGKVILSNNAADEAQKN